jgi:hypothetical protein
MGSQVRILARAQKETPLRPQAGGFLFVRAPGFEGRSRPSESAGWVPSEGAHGEAGSRTLSRLALWPQEIERAPKRLSDS